MGTAADALKIIDVVLAGKHLSTENKNHVRGEALKAIRENPDINDTALLAIAREALVSLLGQEED